MFTWLKQLFSRHPQGESYEDFLKRWNARLDGSDFYEPTLGIYEPTTAAREDEYPDSCPVCHEFCDCCSCGYVEEQRQQRWEERHEPREDGHSLEKYKALTDPNYYDALWERDYPHDPAFYDDHQRFVDDMYASADAYGYDDEEDEDDYTCPDCGEWSCVCDEPWPDEIGAN